MLFSANPSNPTQCSEVCVADGGSIGDNGTCTLATLTGTFGMAEGSCLANGFTIDHGELPNTTLGGICGGTVITKVATTGMIF